ncbi:MAG TPA: type III polyketide synthase, partial [Gemmataceae bacterium]|nr:type III polyketide synthase [Gemmataceae bacterium]
MSLAILGLGTALPPGQVPQDVALRVARAVCCRTEEQATWLPSIYAGTGIRNRHSVFHQAVVRDVLDGTRHSGSDFVPAGPDDDHGPTCGVRMRHYAEHAPPLAVRAAGAALAESGRPPGAITHVVTVSCTGFRAPGVDVALVRELGLPPTAERTHIGFMGCHGALNGLRVARALAAEPSACVLVCAVELCSLHYHYGWDPQKMVANALFADGAAAVVGTADGPAGAWRVAATGSCLFPGTEDAMTWTVGDHNFEMTLARRLPGLIASGLRPWLERWLGQNGVRLAEVGSWAIHPGGPRILEAVGESLGLPGEAGADSRAVLADHGNMSSPTLLFILDRLRR